MLWVNRRGGGVLYPLKKNLQTYLSSSIYSSKKFFMLSIPIFISCTVLRTLTLPLILPLYVTCANTSANISDNFRKPLLMFANTVNTGMQIKNYNKGCGGSIGGMVAHWEVLWLIGKAHHTVVLWSRVQIQHLPTYDWLSSTDGLSPEMVLGHRLSSGGRKRKENHKKDLRSTKNKI